METEVLTQPEAVALHAHLTIMPEIMETAPHKLGMAAKTSLKQDGAKPGLSGIFNLQDGEASPDLSPWPDAMLLEEASPPPDALTTWGAPWD